MREYELSWARGGQVWVGVVPTGPLGVRLNSSYANRDSNEYKEDLGYALANFSRVIPDGMLVFFASYFLMDSCIAHWKGTAAGGSLAGRAK